MEREYKTYTSRLRSRIVREMSRPTWSPRSTAARTNTYHVARRTTATSAAANSEATSASSVIEYLAYSEANRTYVRRYRMAGIATRNIAKASAAVSRSRRTYTIAATTPPKTTSKNEAYAAADARSRRVLALVARLSRARSPLRAARSRSSGTVMTLNRRALRVDPVEYTEARSVRRSSSAYKSATEYNAERHLWNAMNGTNMEVANLYTYTSRTRTHNTPRNRRASRAKANVAIRNSVESRRLATTARISETVRTTAAAWAASTISRNSTYREASSRRSRIGRAIAAVRASNTSYKTKLSSTSNIWSSSLAPSRRSKVARTKKTSRRN